MSDEFEVPQCSLCRRERGITPMQVMTGQPLGWYSNIDGEFCPECIEKMVRGV